MKESRKIATDVSWTFTSYVINMGVALLVSIALARLLGPTSLGLYQLTVTIFLLIMLLAGMGVPTATIKIIAEYKSSEEETNQILSSSILLVVPFGVFAAIIMFILSDHLAGFFGMPDLIPLLQLISVSFPLRLFVLIHQAYLNGLRLMRRLAVSIVLESSLMLLFALILILSGLGVFGAVLGLICAMLANAIFLILAVKSWRLFTLKNIRQFWVRLLSFGIAIFIGGAVNELNYRTDTLLLGYFTNEEEIGLYSVGVTLSRFLLMIPNAIQRVTYPATSKYWKDQRYQELSLLLQRTTKYAASFLFLVGVSGIIFAKELIFFLYGESFKPSILALQLLLIGITVNSALSRSTGGTLAAIYRQKLATELVLFTTFVNIVLAVILIPEMGIIGAALATSASFALRGILGFFLSFHYTNTRIDYLWFIKAISLSALTLVTYFIASVWVNHIIVGITIIILFLIIVLTVFLAPEDRMFFLELMKETIQRRKTSG
ncbi:MAG: flippase [Candidatus Hodarchaeales archaeon]|jgi:O-antigen/teichoic acid export membrane protein